MQKAEPGRATAIAVFIVLLFLCPAAIAGKSPLISTDKDTYNLGEPINVKFSNAPGNEQDWICIVPVGSPDTEGGDYKYIPKGFSQGVLIFDSQTPGKYEARAYYNYARNGYVVSGRHAFSVVSTPAGETAMTLRMEREINPNNPLERNILPGNGLIYLFQEQTSSTAAKWWYLSTCDVEIKVNGKPIVVLPDSQYYLYSVPAGDVKFTTGTLFQVDSAKGTREEVFSLSQPGETTVKVKPGYVYYLKLKVFPDVRGIRAYLDPVPPHQGENLITNYKLTQFK